ncbi:GntR family transcriptional regulator [Cellvibrio zantedeschiae]|uniref:GntR family transcriptional regulator n=1 Tax=Cellvibrio zantedeschiae TaxID=1237077 RepID=A0ABQ3BAA7_9GAMM|nr:GntR family transcriptional regulator [Cellvibrio zantedeschiae]GGY87199.1 GntR family transcriptional regulator [Cellvibrio zantedeschiae]
MFILNPQSGIPIYRQLIDQVRRMIAGGQLKAGDDLPSVRELALEHAVNPMTISKAYSMLEVEGLLVRQRGKPMQVAAENPLTTTKESRLAHLRPQLDSLVIAAKQLEISDDALIKELKKILNELQS